MVGIVDVVVVGTDFVYPKRHDLIGGVTRIQLEVL
jgi:hypothetical protein